MSEKTTQNPALQIPVSEGITLADVLEKAIEKTLKKQARADKNLDKASAQLAELEGFEQNSQIDPEKVQTYLRGMGLL